MTRATCRRCAQPIYFGRFVERLAPGINRLQSPEEWVIRWRHLDGLTLCASTVGYASPAPVRPRARHVAVPRRRRPRHGSLYRRRAA